VTSNGVQVGKDKSARADPAFQRFKVSPGFVSLTAQGRDVHEYRGSM